MNLTRNVMMEWSMGIEYVNRKGDKYYLQSGKTRTGAPRYHFSKKLKGEPVDQLPDGYEVYESPENAQVFLRKAKPTLISQLEREMVSDGVRRFAGLEHFIIDVEEDSLVVNLPDRDEAEADELLRLLASPWRQTGDNKAWLIKQSSFSKRMRFMLVDAKKRLFIVERWCFLGSIDNWMHLGGPRPLSDLLAKYVEHLGKESFYELI